MIAKKSIYFLLVQCFVVSNLTSTAQGMAQGKTVESVANLRRQEFSRRQ